MFQFARKLLITLFLVAALSACGLSLDGGSVDQGDDGIIVNCEGLAGSYQTTGPRPLENAPPEEPFAPWLLAFIEDGRVLWKYSPEIFTGSFTCSDNLITASFPDGTKKGFEGVFDPEAFQISIEDLIYVKALEE